MHRAGKYFSVKAKLIELTGLKFNKFVGLNSELT
jgi:hypothetical protein